MAGWSSRRARAAPEGRVAHYVCHRHRHNGTCPNALKLPVAEVNEAVLRAIEEHALTAQAVEQVIQLSERDDVREQQDKLARERVDIDKRIKRLLNAIEVGGDAASLVAKLGELEARKTTLADGVAGLRLVPCLDPVVVETRLSEWRRLLRASTTQGRAVLQRVLQGRITFTPRPDGSGYDFAAPTRFDKLFSGLAVKVPAHVPIGDTRGTERIRPEDTLDVDYSALLERAHGKGVASPPGFAIDYQPIFQGTWRADRPTATKPGNYSFSPSYRCAAR